VLVKLSNAPLSMIHLMKIFVNGVYRVEFFCQLIGLGLIKDLNIMLQVDVILAGIAFWKVGVGAFGSSKLLNLMN
jgi:hypothetical protein